jgi:prepilin-type processing-associated H-X9-DG protein
MPDRSREPRWTLLDALVASTVVVVLLGLLAPALGHSRQEAERTRCADNLRQIGRGVDQHVDKKAVYPAVFVRNPRRHGWTAFVLPYLRHDLAEKYDFSANWSDPANAEVIRQPIAIFECPTARYAGRSSKGVLPDTKNTYEGANLDYLATNRISPQVVDSGWLPRNTQVNGILSREQWCRPSEIRDGVSSTILLAEVAGTPAKYVFRNKLPEPMYKKRGFGAWGDAGCYIQGHGHQPDGEMWPGFCAINCTNDDAVYSFHSGGAHLLFADGSVRFASEQLDVFVLLAAISRDNGELIHDRDF